eukprot:2207701-Pleurochrysis_carterae.AAC.1
MPGLVSSTAKEGGVAVQKQDLNNCKRLWYRVAKSIHACDGVGTREMRPISRILESYSSSARTHLKANKHPYFLVIAPLFPEEPCFTGC